MAVEKVKKKRYTCDDLTKRQRLKLKELKEKGYTEYFYKGQVHTRKKKKKKKKKTNKKKKR